MRAIICDDEKSTCEEMEQMLRRFAFETCMELETDVFYEGNTLVQYLKTEQAPDILFLDIELPGKNGVEVGKFIRETMRNSAMFLVYISSRKEYAMELFQNQPFDFLVKPIKQEKLYRVMEKIFDIAGRMENYFVYRNQGDSRRIPYKDILYFESDVRKINIVTEKGMESFYGKLSEVEADCPDSLFLRIHKSFLINMYYVKGLSYDHITMVNGDVLVVSKANRVMVRRKMMEIMSNGNR